MADRRTCGNCVFWAMDKANLDKGSCHFNPPLIYPMQVGPQQINFASRWPIAAAADKACHEHLTEEENESTKPLRIRQDVGS